MSCPEQEMLSAFADDELEPSARAEIERHLTGCTACREFVEQMRWIDAFGRSSLRAIRVRTPSESKVVAEIHPKPRRVRALAMAAAVLALLPMALWLLAYGIRNPRVASRTVQTRLQSTTSFSNVTAATEAAESKQAKVFSDEVFERWAEPYRRLRLPLASMEEVANFTWPEIPPVRPEPLKQKSKS